MAAIARLWVMPAKVCDTVTNLTCRIVQTSLPAVIGTMSSFELSGDTLPSPPSTQLPSSSQESSDEPSKETAKQHPQFYLGDVASADAVILQVQRYYTLGFLW